MAHDAGHRHSLLPWNSSECCSSNRPSAWVWNSNQNRQTIPCGLEKNPTGNWDYVFNSDSSKAYQVSWAGHDVSNYTDYSLCLIVSEVRPEFEFSYCSSTSGSNFSQCDNRLNGWIPMPGVTVNTCIKALENCGGLKTHFRHRLHCASWHPERNGWKASS